MTEEQLAGIFNSGRADDPLARYAMDIIFGEASLEEIIRALKKLGISFEQASRMYELQKQRNPYSRGDKYEWFFG